MSICLTFKPQGALDMLAAGIKSMHRESIERYVAA